MGIFSARPRSEDAGSLGALPATSDRWKLAFEATLKVNEIASSAIPLPNAVRSMVRVAVDLLDAEQGSIMLLDEAGATLVMAASWGLPAEANKELRLPVGESIAGRVLATGKPLLLGRVDGEAFFNFIPKSKPINSSIVVPLRVRGEAVGVLSLAGAVNRPEFTDMDLKVAQMFADQAAGLINRARLHESAEQRSSDLLALVDSSKGLLGTLDLEQLLQKVLDGGSRLSGDADGFACLFNAETKAMERGVFRGIDKNRIGRLVSDPEVSRAIENVDVELMDDEGQCLVAVGLRSPRGTKGVLVVAADPDLVHDREELLRAFGQQCSSAIGAAEMHNVVGRKESEMSSIIRSVPHPIILVDDQGLIVAINAAAEQLFSITASFVSGGMSGSNLNHPEIEELLTTTGEVQQEVLVGNPPRVFKVRVTDMQVPGGPTGRVLIMDDVTTERENAQRQRDFVAMVGHELRTPLTIVKGFARTLMRRIGSASAEEATEALQTIDDKAHQLERLIEDLLYVSKIEAREASLRVEQVDVTALTNTVVDDVIRDFAKREVIVESESNIVWPADETKLSLILRHLVENALKYSGGPDPVTVKLACDDEELRVDVIDHGVGLVSSDIPFIFERFKQLDSTSTRRHGGTGVGLYLCAQLVRVHGGHISVDSIWGKGSTFTFVLPRRSTAKKVVHMHDSSSRRTA